MIKPPAVRYRPAARRSLQLDPLWVVTENFENQPFYPNDPLQRTVELYRGSKGWLTEFKPWEVGDQQHLSDVGLGDGGLLSALRDLFDDATQYRIDGSEWTGQLRRFCYPIVLEVINGQAYIAFLRGVFMSGQAKVGYTSMNTLTGTPIAGTSTVETSAHMASSARYDILYTTIDLETGFQSHSSAPLYKYDITIDSAVSSDISSIGATRPYRWTVDVEHGGFKEILTSLIPISHPYHGCNASELYGYLASSVIPLGQSTFANEGNGSDIPIVQYFNRQNAFLLPFHFIHITQGDLFNKTLSLSTQTDQHVVKSSGTVAEPAQAGNVTSERFQVLYELAKLSDPSPKPPTPTYRECENYRYLGLLGHNSFSPYNAGAVQSADQQLNTGGLEQEDQDTVNAGVPKPLPTTVTPTMTRYNLTTTDPVVFTTYQGQLSFEVGKTSYLMFII